ncbi:MAG: hypothetical protein ABIH52_01275 [Candidatus Aenigmatarchaeota archaeon]
MSLKLLTKKIPSEWLESPPSGATFEGLGERIQFNRNHLYVDAGSVDNFLDFYRAVAEDVNQVSGYEALPIHEYRRDGKDGERVETKDFYGGIQFMFPFALGDLGRYELCVICYTPKKGSDVSESVHRGHEEVEAIQDMGYMDQLVERGVIPPGIKGETAGYIGAIHAARRLKLPDSETRIYMEAMQSASSTDPDDVENVEKAMKLCRL